MSSLRNQLKVFKYGLFYFNKDKSVSILKLTAISKVLNGTNTKPGSTVLVKYGNECEPYEAQIIEVEGKSNFESISVYRYNQLTIEKFTCRLSSEATKSRNRVSLRWGEQALVCRK